MRTGEFDSSVDTFAICTWYVTPSEPRPTAPGRGSEFTPWKAQPLAVTITHVPAATARPSALRVMTVASLQQVAAVPGQARVPEAWPRREAACRGGWAYPVRRELPVRVRRAAE